MKTSIYTAELYKNTRFSWKFVISDLCRIPFFRGRVHGNALSSETDGYFRRSVLQVVIAGIVDAAAAAEMMPNS